MSSRSLHHAPHILLDIRDTARHFSRQDVSEASKGFAAALQQLIIPHNELHKFTRVYVGISRVLHIFYDLNRDIGGQAAGGIRQLDEALDE